MVFLFVSRFSHVLLLFIIWYFVNGGKISPKTWLLNFRKKSTGKNNFKLDIFFNELSNNLLNKRTNLDAIISKAVDNEDVYWEGDEEDGKMLGYGVDGMDNIIHFNQNYCNGEAVFPMLDSSLKYENIFRVFSHDINPHNVRVNYGYLSSNKKN